MRLLISEARFMDFGAAPPIRVRFHSGRLKQNTASKRIAELSRVRGRDMSVNNSQIWRSTPIKPTSRRLLTAIISQKAHTIKPPTLPRTRPTQTAQQPLLHSWLRLHRRLDRLTRKRLPVPLQRALVRPLRAAARDGSGNSGQRMARLVAFRTESSCVISPLPSALCLTLQSRRTLKFESLSSARA